MYPSWLFVTWFTTVIALRFYDDFEEAAEVLTISLAFAGTCLCLGQGVGIVFLKARANVPFQVVISIVSARLRTSHEPDKYIVARVCSSLPVSRRRAAAARMSAL